jgi:DNA-nicking Smr family endonuclease
MKEKETIYQFFRKLPDMIRENDKAAGAREETPPTPSPARQPDDQEAFMEAMKDVRKIDTDRMRIPGAPKEGRSLSTQAAHTMEMREALNEERSLNVVNLPEYMEGYIDDVNPLVMEKLRNGEFSVQKVLDLHGFSAEDAHIAFRDFIREAVQSQVCCVKVIHGRGLKSKSGPVLKEKLKEWIVRAMHRKWVVAFASSKMSAGGPGATTILLRARAAKKRLHIIG